MKRLIAFLTVALISVSAQAHEYHFAFAEIAYNYSTKTIQGTISLSAHDFEHSFNENGTPINHLESYEKNTLMQYSLSDELLKHFNLSLGNEKCEFNYIGYEVLNTGMANFYYESQIIELKSPVAVFFDLMMDGNSAQQNKMTFITANEKLTAEFLYNDRSKVLILSKLEE